jgi:hypothetical protein
LTAGYFIPKPEQRDGGEQKAGKHPSSLRRRKTDDKREISSVRARSKHEIETGRREECEKAETDTASGGRIPSL